MSLFLFGVWECQCKCSIAFVIGVFRGTIYENISTEDWLMRSVMHRIASPLPVSDVSPQLMWVMPTDQPAPWHHTSHCHDVSFTNTPELQICSLHYWNVRGLDRLGSFRAILEHWSTQRCLEAYIKPSYTQALRITLKLPRDIVGDVRLGFHSALSSLSPWFELWKCCQGWCGTSEWSWPGKSSLRRSEIGPVMGRNQWMLVII